MAETEEEQHQDGESEEGIEASTRLPVRVEQPHASRTCGEQNVVGPAPSQREGDVLSQRLARMHASLSLTRPAAIVDAFTYPQCAYSWRSHLRAVIILQLHRAGPFSFFFLIVCEGSTNAFRLCSQ